MPVPDPVRIPDLVIADKEANVQMLYMVMLALPAKVADRFNVVAGDDRGFTTAELLGNAALAIVALIAIGGALRLLVG